MIRFVPLLFLLLAAQVANAAQGTLNRYFDTIPQLLASNPNDANRSVSVGGLNTVSDGQGGLFEWFPTATDATNSTTIFQANSTSTGRWKKLNWPSMAVVDTSGFITNYTFITVGTIADLKNVGVASGVQAVEVRGYNDFQDGGEGTFLYLETSTAAEDGGQVFAPNNGAGQWHRRNTPGFVYATAWGPTVTNGTLRAAVNWAFANRVNGKGRVILPGKDITLDFTDTISIPSGIIIEGQAGTRIIASASPSTNYCAFEFDGVEAAGIQNLTFIGWDATAPGGSTNNTGYGFRLNNATNVTWGGLIQADFYSHFIYVGSNVVNPVPYDRAWVKDSLDAWGGDSTGGADSKQAFTNALLCTKTLYIPEGNWKLRMDAAAASGPYLQPQSGSVIEAHPSATISFFTPFTNHAFIQIAPGRSNITVRGGKWIGYRNDDPTFFHTEMVKWSIGGYFALVGDANNITFEDLYLDSFGRGTISIAGPTNMTFRNNVITNARQNGIEVTKGANIKILHNRVFGTHSITNNDPSAGIDVEPNAGDGVVDLEIGGNLFAFNKTGAYIQKANGLCINEVNIHDNYFLSNTLNGLTIVNNTNTAVSGNHAHGNGANGIYLEGVKGATLTANMTRTNGQAGVIVIFGTNTTVNGGISTDNGTSGIQITSGSGAIIGGSYSTNRNRGINMQECHGVLVVGNTANGNYEEGIRLFKTEECLIEGNIVSGNGQQGDDNIDGIMAESWSSRNFITGNKVRKSVIFGRGVPQAGSGTSATLSTNASEINDFYNGSVFRITAGAGAPASNVILDYVGATKVATLQVAWTTPPDGTTVYEISSTNRTRRPINIGVTCEYNRVVNNDTQFGGQSSSVVLNNGHNTVVALPVAEGGTGGITDNEARTNLDAAQRGINADITRLDAISGDMILTNGSFAVPNGRGIIVKDSAGVSQFVLIGDAGDNLVLQALDAAGDITFKDADGNTRARIMGNPANQLRLYRDGTTGAPAITWQTNSTTGIFIPTPNTLGFTANNGERLRIDGAGMQLNAGPLFRSGAGTPEGVVTAGVGSVYFRTDGGSATTLYIKESGIGNTGWVGAGSGGGGGGLAATDIDTSAELKAIVTDETGSGGGLMFAIHTVAAKTADYPVVAGDAQTIFTNEGTTAKRNNTLPGAAAGLTYTFIVQDTDGVTVTAAAGDTIRIASSVSAAAGNIDTTTLGSTVTLVAINATEWIATSVIGTWTVN